MDQKEHLIVSGMKKISPPVRAAFFGALIFGLFAQGMGLFNKFSHHDDVAILFEIGTTISSGRWALELFAWAERLLYGTGQTSLPLFNGTVSLLCIAAAAGMLVHLLRIRSRVFAALLGGLMAAFPVVTALFGYMFTCHAYLVGMLMMVICACLMCEKTPWWAKIAGICLGGVGIGIYQAFLPMMVAAILFYHIREMAEGEDSFADWGKKVLVHALCVAGVMAFYLACNRFFLIKYQVQLSDYMGVSQMGRMSLQELTRRVRTAYREFLLPVPGSFTDMFPGAMRQVHALLLAAEGLLAVRMVIQTGKKCKWKAALLGAMFLAVPLAVNLIFVMVEEGIHSLMVYGQVMNFVLLCFLADRMDFSVPGLRRGSAFCASLLLGLTAVMFARYDHQCYLKDQLHQQEAISYYTTLITRIKSLPGYRPEMEVFFVNAEDSTDSTVYNIDELDFIQINPYWPDSMEYLHCEARNAFMRVWCGADFPTGWDPELPSDPEVKAMPAYPADGSLRILQDAVVIKFNGPGVNLPGEEAAP